VKSLLQSAAVLALLTLGVSTAVIGYDLHHVLLDADTALRDTDKAVVAINGSAADLSLVAHNVNVTLYEAQSVVLDLHKTTTAEQVYWNKTAKESSDAARDLRQLIARTDRQLNDHVLVDLDRNIGETSAAMQLSLEAIAHSADTLTFQMQDPAIAQMAAHLNDASASVSAASQNAADATAHLDKATVDIETAVHRVTRPPSMLKSIGMGILDIASKLGSVAAGFVR
jgi:hypothetical protein